MKVRYVIDPDGSITLDFNGFQGKACIDEVKKILEALKEQGINIDYVKQELKPEYYQKQEEVVEQ